MYMCMCMCMGMCVFMCGYVYMCTCIYVYICLMCISVYKRQFKNRGCDGNAKFGDHVLEKISS